MEFKEIPVRVTGPGSQPVEDQDDALSYMNMPRGMSKFVRPEIPEPDAVAHLDGARETVAWLRGALSGYREGDGPTLANLSALDAESRELVNQILGEGEVSVACAGPVQARTQESVLAGVWRTLYADNDDNIVCDVLEVGAVPHTINVPDDAGRGIDKSPDGVPSELVNALPILVELDSHVERFERDETPHVINLTLLPLSEEEVAFVDDRLGRGAVDVLSRAYGKCQVIRTLTPNVWWVRYYNSMDTLILNTLEVVDVPQVVAAAPEDIADSQARLDEIVAPYWTDAP
jgi:hydrogenase-1 operon protein HyaF